MKMQRSTALRIYAEIDEALNGGDPELISLSDTLVALMKDAIARDELAQEVNNDLTGL